MPTLRVTITGRGRKAMADLVRTHHVRVLHATVRQAGSRRYLAHQGIEVGNKRFSAADIRKIVSSLDLFVFPQANPDGRQWSMTKDPMWRKNRRPPPPASSGAALRRSGPQSQFRLSVEVSDVFRSVSA